MAEREQQLHVAVVAVEVKLELREAGGDGDHGHEEDGSISELLVGGHGGVFNSHKVSIWVSELWLVNLSF